MAIRAVTADTRKTIVILAYMVSTTVLVSLGKLDASLVFGSGSFLVGLMAGNGKNAIQGVASAPVIAPKNAKNITHPKPVKKAAAKKVPPTKVSKA